MLLPEPVCPEATHSHGLHDVLGGVCSDSLAPRVLLCTLVLEGGAPSPVVPPG